MSGSGRGDDNQIGLVGAILVAVLGIAAYWAMFYDMGFQTGQNERKADVEAEHYASDTAKQIERECSTEAGQSARKCITEIVAAEREGQRNESDLAAQWKAANWVMWAGILAAAQLILSGFGLWALLRTIRQGEDGLARAAEANTLSRSVAAVDLRPYLFVDRLELDDIEDAFDEIEKDGITKKVPTFFWCKVVIYLHNYGKVPARNIKVYKRSYLARFYRGRFHGFRASHVDTPVCAPGHERRVFDQIFIKREDRAEFDDGGLEYILRLRYSYQDDRGETFSECADYRLAGSKLDTFYLLLGPHNYIAKVRNHWDEIEPDLYRDEPDAEPTEEGQQDALS